MTQQKQNPKIDWGYYATTPRIVRTHYKKLTHVEKWLYVCLKDLCGDTGTCYRTLRVLSEETDLSTGTLSTGIRHLQEAGLIHAEKKRRNNNPTAKEVWHITIVDIWQENGKVHPTAKCSGDEQKRSPDEHSDKNVQGMNNNVQEMNKEASKRSPDEQKRSNFDDRSNNTEAIPITEERTIEGESNSDDTPKPPVVSSDTARASLSQDEKMFTDEKPQGDDHATAASGHSHRLDDTAAPNVGHSHRSGHAARLEAQEIDDKGDTHANCVPPLPAANTPASGELAPSRHPQDHSDGVTLPAHGLPVVRPVGSATPEQQTNRDGGVVGRDAAHTLAETPTTPMPAQSLPFPQAEQAASGIVQHVDLNGGVTAFQEPGKPNQSEDQKAAKPLVEPDMSGKWSHEKCVEYAEWCNQRRYTNKMHEEQIKAAHAIHKNDTSLTLEQFKQAYDERNDAWWKEHKGKLHVNDMKARGSSGIDRVHEMLQRIEDTASRSRAQPRLQVVARQSTVKRYSSYDDPNFRSDQDFYPVEGGSYATASV